ncbi:PREDICTED: uncharacterized protein LOC107354278 isoform X2 [Acropora digitifera]|uniref:uncharacterized protein LOC107354278 isoform X2 n=1 Tax=Acropora digitifera TaxID=70779 RepID=UPI00077AB70B|nr:PREDICTED: uncharacterized protein LOC107354278 isoform X2 [Acropora digitifera]
MRILSTLTSYCGRFVRRVSGEETSWTSNRAARMTYLKYHIEENRGIPAESGQVKMKAFLLSLATLLACIVLTESAPHSPEIREAFEEQVRNDLQGGKSE